jgi:hypothetical protein
MMSDDELYKRAEKRADAKIGFYKHLSGFVIANVFFILINVLYSPGKWWFLGITGIWAVGLIIHFLKAFVLVDKIDVDREKMIEDEMRKMKK